MTLATTSACVGGRPAAHITTACMGGWCAKRDHCANYHAANRSNPVERLCAPGADGMGPTSLNQEPDMTRPSMTGTRINRRTHEQLREVVLAAVDDKGTTTKRLYQALGYSHTRNVMKVLYKMIAAGDLFNAKCAIGVKQPEAYWFRTQAARDAFHAAYKADLAKRRKAFQAKWRATENEKRRAKAAAESRPVKPPKAPKPPNEPKPVTVKTAKRERTPPKPKTRRDGELAARMHIVSKAKERVPQRVGVAHLPGEADTSQAKITRIEPPPNMGNRYYVAPESVPMYRYGSTP